MKFSEKGRIGRRVFVSLKVVEICYVELIQLRSELATAEELRQAVDAEEVGPLQMVGGCPAECSRIYR